MRSQSAVPGALRPHAASFPAAHYHPLESLLHAFDSEQELRELDETWDRFSCSGGCCDGDHDNHRLRRRGRLGSEGVTAKLTVVEIIADIAHEWVDEAAEAR